MTTAHLPPVVWYPALCLVCGHQWDAAAHCDACPECGVSSLDVAYGPATWDAEQTRRETPPQPSSALAAIGREAGLPFSRLSAALRRHWLRLLVGLATGAYVATGAAFALMLAMVAYDVHTEPYYLSLALQGLLMGCMVGGALVAYNRRRRP